MKNDSIMDTVGIELETDCIKRGNLPVELRQYFNEEHDASIETKVLNDPQTGRFFQLDREQEIDGLPMTIVGSELVSRVFEFKPEYEKAVRRLTGYLYSKGETEESERSGIHFHISMIRNLNALKNFLKISAHLEQVLYYLGGMGYQFRGVKNDCTYCRPITKFGPNAVKLGSKYFQIFQLEDMYQAKSISELFDMYGGINIENPPSKYFPVRYGLVTLYPILTKGTVEFRGFNKTLNPEYIWAAAKFCRAICYRSLQSSKDLEENSIYDWHDKDHVLETFLKFVHTTILGDDSKTVNTLRTIIERTPEISLPPVYYTSHLSAERLNFNYRGYTPKVLPDGAKVRKPDFIDIHRLEREGR